LHKHSIQKILVVDVDVHQGNGTAKIFEFEDRVFTFSIHGEKNFPTRKEKSNLDIGLPDKTDDNLYLNTLKNVLPRLVDEIQPEFIFYLSGVDIIESDKLGRLSVSKQGCKERDRYSLDLFKKNNIPVAISMGGGYSHKLADIVDCHANTFRVAQDLYF
jgi:acetoin utilization deacetylase AcuC-like enzyme